MMSLQRNYYEVLGLPPGATTDQIKKKYRELARKFHPDVVQDKVLGQRVFTQINQAYSVLGNPERRAQYNGTLSSSSASPAEKGPKAGSQTQAPQAATSPLSRPVSPVKSQAFTEMLSRAENAIMAGQPVQARAFCMRILEAGPRNVRALEILGDALVQMGRREEAAVQYRQALQIVPSTMIQAKLNRVAATQPSTKTIPPQSASAPLPRPGNGTGGNGTAGNGAQRTIPPSSAGSAFGEAEKPSGLLDRLLGRK